MQRTIHRRWAGRYLATACVATTLVFGVAAGTSSGAVRPSASGGTVTASVAYEIAHAGQLNTKAFCGTKPITLGIEDGFGVNAWSQASMAAVRSEAAKCPNVKQVVQIGEGSLQTSISQINSMVAQGVNSLVVIPDFGQSELPAIQKATQAGVKVVPWAANPGGSAPADYVSYVDWTPPYSGRLFAIWMAQQLHGHGNVVVFGGPAGNPVSAGVLGAVVSVFKKYPGMHLLTGTSTWATTNWDPATAQQVAASLVAKYPKINGIISDYGTDALSALHAFQAAGRKLPAVAVADANGLGCLWQKQHASQPNFKLATVSTRNWMGRVAARKAIAAAEGIKDTEPSLYNLTFFENSVGGLTPQCDPAQPSDRYLSDQLTPAVISKYGKV